MRQITKRNRAVSLEQMIGEANTFLAGWVMYFRQAHARSELRGLDGWLRRKLRCVRFKQCKAAARAAALPEAIRGRAAASP